MSEGTGFWRDILISIKFEKLFQNTVVKILRKKHLQRTFMPCMEMQFSYVA